MQNDTTSTATEGNSPIQQGRQQGATREATQYNRQTDSDGASSTSIVVPAQPVVTANPTIVDGTLLTVAFASLVGVVKMALPFFGTMVKTGQDAKLQAMHESRKAELDNEAAVGATMRAMLERSSDAAIAMNKASTDALTGRVMTTLDAVVQKLTELGAQISHLADSQKAISDTQENISSTQLRTMEILAKLESNMHMGPEALSPAKAAVPRPVKRIQPVLDAEADESTSA